VRTGSSRKRPKREERVLHGLGVSEGIAIGTAHLNERGIMEVPDYPVAAAARAAEHGRLDAAVKRSRRQVEKLRAKAATLPDTVAEELGFLLDAHLHMLADSRLIRGAARRISEDGRNAEAAVQAEIAEIAAGFAAVEDSYLAARIQDVREVGDRLVRSLTNRPYQALSHLPPGSVILTEELSPAETALIAPGGDVAGFATVLGGVESHTAIMARSLGLPAVLGVPALMHSGIANGDTVIVDGAAGVVVIAPTAATLADYEEKHAAFLRERQRLNRLRDLPARTRDGVEICLQGNLELPGELESVLAAGAEGIGLLRSEFLYMNREDLPGEEEQYRALAAVVEAMDGKPVTVRTLDVGSEKLLTSLGGRVSEGANPALGLRAIRLSLKEQPLLETQLAAILRASAHGPVRILLPMISTTGEVRAVRRILEKIHRRLRRRKVAPRIEIPPLGVMIEVPGAALTADALARDCDFFAIGTNDLTMYTLAIDRGDDQVAHLYNPLHPAVLRLIQFATEAAHRAGIPVSLCGEMAGDPRCTVLLLGLGIRELSMAAGSIPRVKERVRKMDHLAANRRANMVMDQWDPGRIAALLDDFNALA
jgi:phosphoenolpyruvate-protein phosphotransferase (PTS system enzyme I)